MRHKQPECERRCLLMERERGPTTHNAMQTERLGFWRILRNNLSDGQKYPETGREEPTCSAAKLSHSHESLEQPFFHDKSCRSPRRWRKKCFPHELAKTRFREEQSRNLKVFLPVGFLLCALIHQDKELQHITDICSSRIHQQHTSTHARAHTHTHKTVSLQNLLRTI